MGAAEETLEQARERDRAGRVIEVLVLVKTTPNPSTSYEDTVCVAGVALSPGPLRWVRLYPIPFRHLTYEQRFPKYGLVSVRVSAPRHGDGRAESLRVDLPTLATVRTYKPGRERDRLMAGVPLTTACGLLDGTRADPNAQSLGLVEAHGVQLEVEPSGGWNAKQQQIIDQWRSQPMLPLLDGGRVEAPPLEAPPYKAWYSYRCTASACPGHRQGILDWELTALQRNAKADGADPRNWIRDKYETMMLKPGRVPLLVLGNQADAAKRTAFSVLSVYYPKREAWTKALNTQAQSALF